MALGLIDGDNFWAATNDNEEEPFIYDNESQNSPSGVFSYDKEGGKSVENDRVILSLAINLTFDDTLIIEHDSSDIYVLGLYNENDILSTVDNYFYGKTALRLYTTTIISMVITLFTLLYLQSFKSFNDAKIYSFISEYSSDGIIITDSKNKTIFTNGTFNKLFGVSATELYGQIAGKNKVSSRHSFLVKENESKLVGHVWNTDSKNTFMLLKIHIQKIKSVFGMVKSKVALYRNPDSLSFTYDQNPEESTINHETVIVDFLARKAESMVHEDFSILILERKAMNSDTNKAVSYNQINELSRIIDNRFDVISTFLISNDQAAYFLKHDGLDYQFSINSKVESLFVSGVQVSKLYYLSSHKISSQKIKEGLKDSFLMLELSKILNQQICEYNDIYIETFKRHTTILNMLQNDMSEIDFYLDYQTQRRVSDKRVVGAEALIRIHDETLGRIAPNEFIPILQKMKRSKNITRIIVKKMLSDLDKTDLNQKDNFTVSINLTADDLDTQHVMDNIIIPIVQSKYDCKMFGIEITEDVLVSDITKAESILKLLKTYGFKLYLDDFGTGYSSLSYISQLDFDVIKIDRHFVSYTDEKTTIILKIMLTLCAHLSIEAVVEGVENAKQLELIKKLGSTYYQGFYDSIPSNIENVVKSIESEDKPE